MAIVKGMDLEKLEAFQASLKENPVTLGLESKSAWEGHSGRNTTHIGPENWAGKRLTATLNATRSPTARGGKLKKPSVSSAPQTRLSRLRWCLEPWVPV